MILFEHPQNVCMTYTSHFYFSMYLCFEFAKASIAAFIHACYPDVFVTYSSDTVKELLKQMEKVGCR